MIFEAYLPKAENESDETRHRYMCQRMKAWKSKMM